MPIGRVRLPSLALPCPARHSWFVRLDVITLFPELITVPMGTSIMGRAQEKGAVTLGVHDLRDHGLGRHKQVDDTPYGGGQGMLLRPEPLFAALEKVHTEKARVILMSPAGKRFDQAAAQRLAGEEHLVFLSGHYEGMDQRVVDHWVDEELSLGDYVLTNGAIAAVIVMDAIVRLLPGVLGDDLSAVEESFGPSGLLEAPHYTKPAEYAGLRVPDILLSGNHGKIAEWRQQQALERTRRMRPDLLE
ncbi:tRNA (guanine37-N1)-methyltransferase [Prosthecobacter fusiformis]|uniref:tRNA (guanine-N(1)-)-methyltransferase n=1 Tax=Prosthecobacter fusiformis TaxID=48464 RepID=A0A4R7RNA8_9BACT|nr:tRNA (guanine37-N1)-methyltransferase [Prosthecobacter fusiformis]